MERVRRPERRRDRGSHRTKIRLRKVRIGDEYADTLDIRGVSLLSDYRSRSLFCARISRCDRADVRWAGDGLIVLVSSSVQTRVDCDWSCDVWSSDLIVSFFFFFQAEDGIRDLTVLEFRRVLFRSRAAANFANHDDAARVGVIVEKFDDVEVRRAVDGIAADANARALPDTARGKLPDRFVSQDRKSVV